MRVFLYTLRVLSPTVSRQVPVWPISRESIICAEATWWSPHKQTCRLTPRLAKKTISGWTRTRPSLPATQVDAAKLWSWTKRAPSLPRLGPSEDARSPQYRGLFHTLISFLVNHSFNERAGERSSVPRPSPELIEKPYL